MQQLSHALMCPTVPSCELEAQVKGSAQVHPNLSCQSEGTQVQPKVTWVLAGRCIWGILTRTLLGERLFWPSEALTVLE